MEQRQLDYQAKKLHNINIYHHNSNFIKRLITNDKKIIFNEQELKQIRDNTEIINLGLMRFYDGLCHYSIESYQLMD